MSYLAVCSVSEKAFIFEFRTPFFCVTMGRMLFRARHPQLFFTPLLLSILDLWLGPSNFNPIIPPLARICRSVLFISSILSPSPCARLSCAFRTTPPCQTDSWRLDRRYPQRWSDQFGPESCVLIVNLVEPYFVKAKSVTLYKSEIAAMWLCKKLYTSLVSWLWIAF
jgi:hypothetical protein